MEGEIRVAKVPTQERRVAISAIPINLGVIVKARKLEAFEQLFRSHL